ncbi:hypothetical protein KIPB_012141, partial [Kipferlia bialata]|eukprot:g12141.t1
MGGGNAAAGTCFMCVFFTLFFGFLVFFIAMAISAMASAGPIMLIFVFAALGMMVCAGATIYKTVKNQREAAARALAAQGAAAEEAGVAPGGVPVSVGANFAQPGPDGMPPSGAYPMPPSTSGYPMPPDGQAQMGPAAPATSLYGTAPAVAPVVSPVVAPAAAPVAPSVTPYDYGVTPAPASLSYTPPMDAVGGNPYNDVPSYNPDAVPIPP